METMGESRREGERLGVEYRKYSRKQLKKKKKKLAFSFESRL